MTLLDTGVRVLPQRDWEERERRIYQRLYGSSMSSIRIDIDGTLVLPCLAGDSLAHLLEDSELEPSVRNEVIEGAVVALAEFHRLGFTHGDAMAENVMIEMIDFEAGIARCRWFDFETTHESSRDVAWRRADDLRALLVTCLIRTVPARLAETLQLILDVYADEEVARVLAVSFATVFRRSLTFHLAQAGLSFEEYREIARLLRSLALRTESLG